MWSVYLVCTLGIFFFIGMLSYCFIFVFTMDREEKNRCKQSSFDKKLLEHCKVRSNPNDVGHESEENNEKTKH